MSVFRIWINVFCKNKLLPLKINCMRISLTISEPISRPFVRETNCHRRTYITDRCLKGTSVLECIPSKNKTSTPLAHSEPCTGVHVVRPRPDSDAKSRRFVQETSDAVGRQTWAERNNDSPVVAGWFEPGVRRQRLRRVLRANDDQTERRETVDVRRIEGSVQRRRGLDVQQWVAHFKSYPEIRGLVRLG